MKLPDWCLSARLWLAAYGVWFLTLWLLSAGNPTPPGGFEIPHLDKICHFGYFFGGGGLLAAALYCRAPDAPAWPAILLSVAIAAAVVGWFDEWHQSFTPGRSANDLGDWLADVLGGIAGGLVFRLCHRVLGAAAQKVEIS